MAEGLNRVLLLGNLGADPELRMTNGGQAVLRMRLATSETYLDRNRVRQERTEWHTVVVWGRRAEALAKFLTKGTRLFVEGGLRSSSYEDREGVKRYKTEIVANDIILAGGGGRGGSRGDDYGAAPQERGPSAPQDEPPGGYDDPGAAEGGEDDDIPF